MQNKKRIIMPIPVVNLPGHAFTSIDFLTSRRIGAHSQVSCLAQEHIKTELWS